MQKGTLVALLSVWVLPGRVNKIIVPLHDIVEKQSENYLRSWSVKFYDGHAFNVTQRCSKVCQYMDSLP